MGKTLIQQALRGPGKVPVTGLQSITVQFSPKSWFQYDEVIICQEQEQELHKKI